MTRHSTYQNKPFDSSVQMGVMISPLLMASYRTFCGGQEALDQLFLEIDAACEAQDGEKLLTLRIVEAVVIL